MARRPFKVVSDIDLAGNSLLDVKLICRQDYETLSRVLTVRAGSATTAAGGDLNLYSGSGTVSGAINLFLGKDSVNKYGIEILGSSATTLKTNNQDIAFDTGTGRVRVLSANDTTSNTTGALQVAGGLYVAKTLRISGDVVTSQSSASVVNTNATTVNIAGAATELNLANTVNASQTIRIGASVAGTNVQSIILGGATSAGTVTVSSTKEASESDAALKVNGGILAAKALIGLTKLVLPNSSPTNPLQLGDTLIYEELECLHITSCLVLDGMELTAPEVFNFAKDTLTLNIASYTGTTTIRNNLVVDGTTELKGAVPYIYMDPQSSIPDPAAEGLLYYSEADSSLNYITDIPDVTVNLGFESLFRVANNTGAPIPNGAPIYLTGAIAASGSPYCALAQANGAVTARVIGIATNEIASGAEGYASVHGLVRGVNTTGYTAGALLYLDAALPGKLTATPPSAGNYVIRIARVLTVAESGNLLVSLGVAWSDTSTFNITRINELSVSTSLVIPNSATPAQTVAGALVWNTTAKVLTVGDGASRVVLVDTSSEQALTNKTVNGLTITDSSGTLTIANGFTLDVQANLTTQSGPVILNGHADGGSELVLPDATITISELSEGYLLYASSANTIAGLQALDAVRGGTGIYSYTEGDLLIASGVDSLTTLPLGDANQILGVSEDGLSLIYKTVSGGGDVIISNEDGVLTIATTQSVAPDANVTFESLTLAGYLAVNGGTFSSTAAAFSFLNGGVTTINMLGAADSTLNVGANDASTRKVNMFADLQIGTATTVRVVDLYGQLNFGGPTGYTIRWNSADNSLDFVKL